MNEGNEKKEREYRKYQKKKFLIVFRIFKMRMRRVYIFQNLLRILINVLVL